MKTQNPIRLNELLEKFRSHGNLCVAHGDEKKADGRMRRYFPLYENMTFDQWQTETRRQESIKSVVIEWTRRAIENDPAEKRWIVLSGQPGTGKTMLLAAAYRALIDANMFVAVYSGDKLLSRIEKKTTRGGIIGANGYPVETMSIRDAVADALQCQIILIDDLVVDAKSPPKVEYMYALINHCYEHKKRLLFATMLQYDPKNKIDQLTEVFGAAVVSRISQFGAIANFDWPDFRGRKGE